MSNRSCLALVLLVIGAGSALAQGGSPSPGAAVPGGPRFAKIRAELERLVGSGALPSVAVGVVRRGQVEWAEAFGLADRAERIPATVDTPYRIASMGKAMTATTVMTLVEAGRLRLDARVDEILGPGALRVLAGDRAPTVREVLDMTAGIPHGAATYRVPDPPTESEVLRRHAVVVFPPGETFHYSNFSMAVADAVIEAVTGGAFADDLHERVFAPLQMTHSTLGGSANRPAAAQPYDAGGERHVDARFPRSSRQMQSSLMDLLKFAAFQLGTPMPAQRPVLGTDSIRLMQRQRSQAAGAHWALGFGSLDIGDERRWVLSSGNDIGVQSHLTLVPHAGLGVVVLSNGSGDHADELGIRIADAVVDGFAEAATAAIRAYEARTTTFTASREWAGAWAGRVAAPGGDLPLKLSVDPGGAIRVVLGEGPLVVVEDVKQRDGTLTGAFTGRLPLEETPEGEHRIELTLRTSGDTLTGFAVANFRSARGKFELPVPVALRRER